MNRSDLELEIKLCTVKISDANNIFLGTGFFVLPNTIITCRHVFNSCFNEELQLSGANKSTKFLASKVMLCDEADLAYIEVDSSFRSKHYLPVGNCKGKAGDKLVGYTFNKDYVDGCYVKSELIEEANHRGVGVFRIKADSIQLGSSGSPIWNLTQDAILGVVYWYKERKNNALVIPFSIVFSSFPELLLAAHNLGEEGLNKRIKKVDSSKKYVEAIQLWTDKLLFLEKELVLAVDPVQKFTLNIRIKECKSKIDELKSA